MTATRWQTRARNSATSVLQLLDRESGATGNLPKKLLGAQEGTRTPTVLPPLGPEPSASTNSATWATATHNFTFRTISLSKKPAVTRSRAPKSPAAKRPRRARRARRIDRSRRAAASASRARRSRSRRRSRAPRRHRSRAAAVARGDPRRAEGAGVPLPPAELARAMAVDKRARDAFFGRIAAMQRDGQLLMNRKGELCVVAKLDLITGTVQGHPDGFGFLVPDDGGADLFLSPREMHKVLHGDRATARRSGVDRRGRPEGEIVDVLDARQPRRSSAASTRSAASRSSSPRTGGSTRTCSCRRTSAAARSPATSSSSRSSSSRRRSARRSRASSRCSAATPIPAWRSRSRCASTICRTSSRSRRASRPASCPTEVDRARPRGPRRPHALAARHHRRRNGEGLRRRRLLRAQGQGLPPDRRDRRRLALRAGRRRARPRCARARHVGLFPAPRDPDAAGGAVERALLAQAGRRPAVHGVRHGRDRRGPDREVRVLPGGHALARAAHLHAGVELAVGPGERAARRRRRCCRTSPISTRSSRRCSARAKRAARSTSTRVEMQLEFDVQGKIVAHRAGRAQRRAQADRGMHARGERLHRGVPRAAQAPGALPRARRPDAREARGAARFPRELRAARCPAATTRPPRDYAKLLLRIKRPPRLRAAADGAAALAAAGALPAGQRRPLRPLLRGLRALHVADPPLSRSARPSRDQGRARRQRVQARRACRGASSACTAR